PACFTCWDTWSRSRWSCTFPPTCCCNGGPDVEASCWREGEGIVHDGRTSLEKMVQNRQSTANGSSTTALPFSSIRSFAIENFHRRTTGNLSYCGHSFRRPEAGGARRP